MIDQEIHSGVAPPKPTNGEGRTGEPAGDPAHLAHAEAASFAPRRATPQGDRTEDTVEIADASAQLARDAAFPATDEFKQMFDVWTRHGADLVRGSRERFQALADCNNLVARAGLDISRAWIDLVQARARRRADSFAALVRCRTAEEFATVEGRRLQDNLEQLVDTHRRVAALSLDVLQGAANALIGKDQAAARD